MHTAIVDRRPRTNPPAARCVLRSGLSIGVTESKGDRHDTIRVPARARCSDLGGGHHRDSGEPGDIPLGVPPDGLEHDALRQGLGLGADAQDAFPARRRHHPGARRPLPRSILTAAAGGRAFTIAMTGEAESPAGDPVGTGTATIRMRAGQGQVCYRIAVRNLTAVAAHIHRGAASVAGPVVVPLNTPNASGAAERVHGGRAAARGGDAGGTGVVLRQRPYGRVPGRRGAGPARRYVDLVVRLGRHAHARRDDGAQRVRNGRARLAAMPGRSATSCRSPT